MKISKTGPVSHLIYVSFGLILLMNAAGLPGLLYAQMDTADGERPETIPAQTEYYWGELMHYAMIGRWDLARSNGEALLNLPPNPITLLRLAESDQYAEAYRNLMLLQKDTPLKDIADRILEIVEQGRFMLRTDTSRIAEDVKRLSGTTRGRMLALRRLKDSGEWAVPVMIEAIRDPERSEEISVIKWALPQLGKPAVTPLVAVLQQCRELNVRLIALDVLEKLGYKESLPYIKQVIEDPASPVELKNAALGALESISTKTNTADKSASLLFRDLGNNYYNHLPSLQVPAIQDLANIWFWDNRDGLYKEQVARDAFDELMAMRCCELSVKLNSEMPASISLWLSAFFRLEAEGHSYPEYFGQLHPDADTYALTAGPEYLHRTLGRALDNRNRPVALSAIKALQRNSGQQSLLFEINGVKPLVAAMSYPDREIRFSAALAIGGVLPEREFEYSDRVVPILAEALRQKGNRYAMLVADDDEFRNQMLSQLRETNEFADIIASRFFSVAEQQSRDVPSINLVILTGSITQPNLKETLQIMKDDYHLAFCPTIILADERSLQRLQALEERYPFVRVMLKNANLQTILQTAQTILFDNNARPFSAELADQYAIQASQVLRELAVSENEVLPLQDAEAALIDALYEQRETIQQDAVVTLARLNSSDAQRAIASLALDDTMPLEKRLAAFANLSRSAKQHGNLLLTEQVDRIYEIVSSFEANSELRTLASQAHGSLNLPSEKIRVLILNQSHFRE